jgi:hypothetical protein
MAISSEISFEQGIEALQIKIDQKKIEVKSSNILMPSFEHQDFIFVQNGKTNSEPISTLRQERAF